ncbi:MAG: hypothetical protein GTO18_21280 [Anaerolineales bacterium]|nr:hypothetical protein [Anaerolineales bacterium]
MVKRSLLLILGALLAACASTPTPTPEPAPVYRIVTIPALEATLIEWMTEYSKDVEEFNLKLEVLAPGIVTTSVSDGDVELAVDLRLPPVDWFSTPLAVEPIAIIVNPAISIDTIEVAELTDLFSGRIPSWSELTDSTEDVQPIIPIQGDPVREYFHEIVMGGTSYSTNALLGSRPASIIQLVEQNPGGIGFVPLSQVRGDVNVLLIGGVTPSASDNDDENYPLHLTIIAMAPNEPVDPVRNFLLWLQTEESKAER